MEGADSIAISSDSRLWAEKGWNPAAGVTVVVGVKILKQVQDPYTLILTNHADLAKREVSSLNVGGGVNGEVPATAAVTNGVRAVPVEHLYRVYNWEHKDIIAKLTMTSGSGTIMYQKTGEKDFSNNLYTAIPINRLNSQGYAEVQEGASSSLTIDGSQCYTCWYFFKVLVKDPKRTAYRLELIRDEGDGARYKEIGKGTPVQVYVASGYQQKKKFMLDSTDNWILEAQVAMGAVVLYVGLNPTTLGPDDHVWTTSSGGGIASLRVKSTDPSFHLATYYYVIVQATSPTDALINLSLKQQRSVDFVPNNHDYTFMLTRPVYDDNLLFHKF